MTAKPTLGFPSRTEALQAFRAQGVPTREIARRLGVAVKTVSALEQSAARTRRIRPAEEMGRTVVVPVDVLDALAPHAARRGLSVNALVRRIVETVADEGIVDAVLDDA